MLGWHGFGAGFKSVQSLVVYRNGDALVEFFVLASCRLDKCSAELMKNCDFDKTSWTSWSFSVSNMSGVWWYAVSGYLVVPPSLAFARPIQWFWQEWRLYLFGSISCRSDKLVQISFDPMPNRQTKVKFLWRFSGRSTMIFCRLMIGPMISGENKVLTPHRLSGFPIL